MDVSSFVSWFVYGSERRVDAFMAERIAMILLSTLIPDSNSETSYF